MKHLGELGCNHAKGRFVRTQSGLCQAHSLQPWIRSTFRSKVQPVQQTFQLDCACELASRLKRSAMVYLLLKYMTSTSVASLAKPCFLNDRSTTSCSTQT
eukprot:scaffold952_cov409-Prasinococcus_capsulatus_cf.AAC.74